MANNAWNDAEICKKYLAGSTYTPGKLRRAGSRQTPGSIKRKDTCQLTPIAGMPRKFWLKSKSYKHPKYNQFCAFQDKVNF